MTIDELRARFDALGLPGDTPVIVALSAAGDGFSPVREADGALYLPRREWFGERFATPQQREESDHPEKLAPAPAESVPAVFLWPME